MERKDWVPVRSQGVGSCSENNLGQNLKRFQNKDLGGVYHEKEIISIVTFNCMRDVISSWLWRERS